MEISKLKRDSIQNPYSKSNKKPKINNWICAVVHSLQNQPVERVYMAIPEKNIIWNYDPIPKFYNKLFEEDPEKAIAKAGRIPLFVHQASIGRSRIRHTKRGTVTCPSAKHSGNQFSPLVDGYDFIRRVPVEIKKQIHVGTFQLEDNPDTTNGRCRCFQTSINQFNYLVANNGYIVFGRHDRDGRYLNKIINLKDAILISTFGKTRRNYYHLDTKQMHFLRI